MGKNNNKFYFAKWLTNRDIEKIIQKLGYEIMTIRDKETNTEKKRIIRGKTNEGYNVIVFCKDLIEMKKKEELEKIILGSKELNKAFAPYIMLTAVMSGLRGDNSLQDAQNMIILNFNDFHVMESMSLKDEKEQVENYKRMTKIYRNYMKEKFGKHYTDMMRAHYKQLYKKAREEQEEM